jgi:hypothetical protein
MSLRQVAALMVTLLWGAGSSQLLAQTTGTLRGMVTDQSGAIIPRAKVSAVLEATDSTRVIVTDERGEFVLPALPVGHYKLLIEAVGFMKFIEPDIEITIGHVVVVSPALKIGTTSESVTAIAAAPLVERSSTQLGAVVDEKTVVDLPLNQRDTYQLLTLQPGVSSQVGSNLFYGSDQTGAVSVNGGRGRSNNFMVNGGNANDQFVNLPSVQPSPDTIQEFRVLTNGFDAEYGRNSGSVVNVVTKSGGNQFHGDVYEFFRNEVLNAKGFFNQTKPDFKQNQFGGTIGGPIRRDSTFFFASYEGRRIIQGIASDVVAVPSQDERNGIFAGGLSGQIVDDNLAKILNNRTGCPAALGKPVPLPSTQGGAVAYSTVFPTGQIPVACMDATAVDLMKRYVPLANRSDGAFQQSVNASTRSDQFTARIDHKLTSSQQLQVYYYFNDSRVLNPFNTNSNSGADLPNFGATNAFRYQQWNLSHSWLLSPETVNEFRFTYLREGLGKFNSPLHTNLVADSCKAVPAASCFSDPANPRLGITPNLGPAIEGTPYIGVSGMFSIGNNWQGALPQIGNAFQWADHFTKIVGNHTIKFGGDIARQRFDQEQLFNVDGQFSIIGSGANSILYSDPIPDYLLGLADSFSQGSAQFENIRNTIVGLYGQDSWKVSRNLTLNYGLRWELNTPLKDVGMHVQAFRPGQATSIFPCQLASGNPLIATFGTNDCSPRSGGQAVFPLGLVFPGDKGVPASLTTTYYKSFAPRLGLAWSPNWSQGLLGKIAGGPAKTSVRVGYGIFYDNIEQLVSEQFGDDPPFGGSAILSNVLLNTPYLSQNGTVNPNPFNGVLNPPRGQPIDWSRFRPIALFGQFPPHLRSQYTEQYNLSIQRQLSDSAVLSLAYVGSQGHRLLATHDLDYGRAQTCLDLNTILGPNTCGPFGTDNIYTVPQGAIPPGVTLHLPYGSVPSLTGPNANAITLVGLRPYSSPLCQPTTGQGCPPDGVPVFGSVFNQDNVANANYNSFQAEVVKRFSKGLQFQIAYTLGKSFDYASSFEDLLNPLDFRRSYSLSQFSAKQRFVFSYTWQFPVPQFTGVEGKLLNGWGTSGIATVQSGFPIRITSSSDLEMQNSSDFLYPGEPDLIAAFHTLDPAHFNSALQGNYAFDPSSFVDQQLGTIGDSPRTICCGPPIRNFDLSLFKDTSIGERIRSEFRAEFFNVFNHSQFYNPDGNISDGANFGKVVRARDPRLIQFALKLMF